MKAPEEYAQEYARQIFGYIPTKKDRSYLVYCWIVDAYIAGYTDREISRETEA